MVQMRVRETRNIKVGCLNPDFWPFLSIFHFLQFKELLNGVHSLVEVQLRLCVKSVFWIIVYRCNYDDGSFNDGRCTFRNFLSG